MNNKREYLQNRISKEKEKLSIWGKLFIAVTIVAYIMMIVLYLGVFTGKKELITNNTPLLLIGKRKSRLMWVYPFDFFFFWTLPGTITWIVKKLPKFLQPFILAGLFLVPLLLHRIIDKYGPWYSDSPLDLIILCVVFSVLAGIGTAYYHISEFFKNSKDDNT